MQQNSARGQREQHPHESSSVPCEDASGRCVADAQICAAEAAPVAGSGDKRQGSENSIEHVDPKTPGWIKGTHSWIEPTYVLVRCAKTGSEARKM